MTTVTFEVPEELGTRLEQLRPQLPALLHWILKPSPKEDVLVELGLMPSRRVFDEMIDFLASGPTIEQIIAYEKSGGAQTRLRELLDKKSMDALTEFESHELSIFQSVDDLMGSLKARARNLVCDRR